MPWRAATLIRRASISALRRNAASIWSWTSFGETPVLIVMQSETPGDAGQVADRGFGDLLLILPFDFAFELDPAVVDHNLYLVIRNRVIVL